MVGGGEDVTKANLYNSRNLIYAAGSNLDVESFVSEGGDGTGPACQQERCEVITSHRRKPGL